MTECLEVRMEPIMSKMSYNKPTLTLLSVNENKQTSCTRGSLAQSPGLSTVSNCYSGDDAWVEKEACLSGLQDNNIGYEDNCLDGYSVDEDRFCSLGNDYYDIRTLCSVGPDNLAYSCENGHSVTP